MFSAIKFDLWEILWNGSPSKNKTERERESDGEKLLRVELS